MKGKIGHAFLFQIRTFLEIHGENYQTSQFLNYNYRCRVSGWVGGGGGGGDSQVVEKQLFRISKQISVSNGLGSAFGLFLFLTPSLP